MRDAVSQTTDASPGRLDIIGARAGGADPGRPRRGDARAGPADARASRAASRSCRSPATPGGSRRWPSRRSACCRCSCPRQATARTPAPRLAQWPASHATPTSRGALLLTTGLGAVILTFASAEPESAAISDQAPWLLPIAVVAFAGLRDAPAARRPSARPPRRARSHARPGAPSSCRSSSAPPSSRRSSTSRSSPA